MATKLNTNTNKTLTQAIQSRDLPAISVVVASSDRIIKESIEKLLKDDNLIAISAIVNPRAPVEPTVETVYGPLKLSAVYDEDTKWEVLYAEYINLSPRIESIIKGNSTASEKTLEVAKVISASDVLRYITAAPVASVDGLF